MGVATGCSARQGTRMRSSLATLFIVTLFHDASCFCSPKSFLIQSRTRNHHETVAFTPTTLLARGGVHGKKSRMLAANKKKKPKKKNPYAVISRGTKKDKRLRDDSKQNKNNNRGKNNNNANDGSAASQKPKVALPGQKKNTPPWQVMKSKEAIEKHIEQEKKRRQAIAEGASTSSGDDSAASFEAEEKTQFADTKFMSEADHSLIAWTRFSPSTQANGMNFVGAYLGNRLPPRLGVPEVAFLGRSNVGKSSLLNRLILTSGKGGGGGDEARVGKTPGATASVNLYALQGKTKKRPILLGLTDLPGFGYAKLSKTVKDEVERAAERYLEKRKELALGILLVDARRIPSDDDRAVLAALYDAGVPLLVVATKVDKLSKTQLEQVHLPAIQKGLGLPEGQPMCVSSVTGQGTKDLWRIVLDACETRVQEIRGDTKDDDSGEGEDEFKDIDDLQYDQGYDWIHEGAVMYERDEDEEEMFFENDEEYEKEQEAAAKRNFNEELQAAEKAEYSLKKLKKIARAMERRGEV